MTQGNNGNVQYNGTLTQKPGTKVNAMLKPEN